MQTTLLKTTPPEQARSDNTSFHSQLAKALALAAMSLGLGVVQLDITIVNTALSSIGTSLGGSVAELQWVVTVYTITFAAFILTAGALGRSEEHTSELQSPCNLVCRLLLEKKKRRDVSLNSYSRSCG